MRHDHILALSCPDRTGIVYRVSGLLFGQGCNILDAQQFGDEETGRFFLRVHFELPRADALAGVRERFETLATEFGMDWQLHDARRRARLLVLVSKQGHCLNDLLFRTRSGYLPIQIPLIIANHPDLESLATFYGVPFEHVPVTPATKAISERRILDAVAEYDIELVVLARYMQILSPELCRELEGRAINIHHSFLPGFKGANPYRQAHSRGVKLIGATAHFVTSELDEGPIIEQNVRRVDHTMGVPQLVAMGQEQEARTLTEAVRLFSQHRVLLDGARTVIFR